MRRNLTAPSDAEVIALGARTLVKLMEPRDAAIALLALVGHFAGGEGAGICFRASECLRRNP